MRRLGFVLLVLPLAGCMFFESSADRAMQRSPNFKSGYADGCASANTQGTNFGRGMVRDEDLYESDRAYRRGWATGMGACRAVAPSSQTGGPIPDRNPGGGN